MPLPLGSSRAARSRFPGVIPSGAQRSRGTCSFVRRPASVPSFAPPRAARSASRGVIPSDERQRGAEGPAVCPPASKRPKFRATPRGTFTLPGCHPERSAAQPRDLQFVRAHSKRPKFRATPRGTFTLPGCHPERSAAQPRDLQFCPPASKRPKFRVTPRGTFTLPGCHPERSAAQPRDLQFVRAHRTFS